MIDIIRRRPSRQSFARIAARIVIGGFLCALALLGLTGCGCGKADCDEPFPNAAPRQ